MKPNPIVSIAGLNKWDGGFQCCAHIDLDGRTSERIGIFLLRPSGSGKSTLIRCITRWRNFRRADYVVDVI